MDALDGGWLVHLPKAFGCGCMHDVLRATYWVGRDGAFCETDDPPALLVHIEDRGCYD